MMEQRYSSVKRIGKDRQAKKVSRLVTHDSRKSSDLS